MHAVSRFASRQVVDPDEGVLTVHVLRKNGYRAAAKSTFFPSLDLTAMATLASAENQTAAVRTFRATLRNRR